MAHLLRTPRQVHLVLIIALITLLTFSLISITLADTTTTLRPTADGGDDSGSWKNPGGSACSGVECFSEVDESSGSDCTNSDGDTSYITSKTVDANQTFDIDESSITDDATVTQIDITVCARYASSGATFKTRYCHDGSCSDSSNITPGATYGENTQSHTVSFTKSASSDIEIGVTNTSGKDVRISQISAVITYSLPADTTPPAAVANLATGTVTTTSIPLTWTAPGDDGNTGTATTYDLRYSTATITDGNFSSATAATGEPTPSVAGSSEAQTISSLSPNTTYHFALKTDDEVPNTSDLSNVPSAVTLANVPVAAAFGDVTTSSIVTNWTTNSNPAGTAYYVENETASTNSGWITTTTWTSSSLSASTTYSFRVKARNADSTETDWVSLGSKSTSADSSSSTTTTTTTSTTSTAATTPTPTPAAATGPIIAAPVVDAPPDAAAIGAPGTTVSDTGVGETVTEVPIVETVGDTTPPTVIITEDPTIVDDEKISLAGTAEDNGDIAGVIAGLAYSLDAGQSWHPVSTAEGLGTVLAEFTIITPPLPDGTYDILIRARDNTDNEGFSDSAQATVDLLPVIFGSTVILHTSGEALETINPVITSDLPLRIISSLAGGVTNATLTAGDQQVVLEPDKNKLRWVGILKLTEPGDYDLTLAAQDGADHTLQQTLGTITVLPQLQIVDAGNQTPLADAQVTLEFFDASAGIWLSANLPNQANPQSSSDQGHISLLTHRGTYRLRVAAKGYWTGVTQSFETDDPTPISGRVFLPRRSWYEYFIPSRLRPTPLTADNLLAAPSADVFQRNDNLNLLPFDVTSNKRNLDEFLGHRILITTLALWSQASSEQLAVLQRLQVDIGKDVIVIPWSIQQPASVLAGIIKRGQYDLTGFADITGQDTESLSRLLFPSHFLFDRQGNLRITRTGFATVPELTDMLREIQ